MTEKEQKDKKVKYGYPDILSMDLSAEGPTFTTLAIPTEIRDKLRNLKVIEEEPYYKVIEKLIEHWDNTHKKKKNLF
jgi:hypothetical protein